MFHLIEFRFFQVCWGQYERSISLGDCQVSSLSSTEINCSGPEASRRSPLWTGVNSASSRLQIWRLGSDSQHCSVVQAYRLRFMSFCERFTPTMNLVRQLWGAIPPNVPQPSTSVIGCPDCGSG